MAIKWFLAAAFACVASAAPACELAAPGGVDCYVGVVVNSLPNFSGNGACRCEDAQGHLLGLYNNVTRASDCTTSVAAQCDSATWLSNNDLLSVITNLQTPVEVTTCTTPDYELTAGNSSCAMCATAVAVIGQAHGGDFLMPALAGLRLTKYSALSKSACDAWAPQQDGDLQTCNTQLCNSQPGASPSSKTVWYKRLWVILTLALGGAALLAGIIIVAVMASRR